MKATIALVAASLFASAAQATTIVISISQTVEFRDGELSALVAVSNSGDEVAHSVTPILRFRDTEVRGTRRQVLGPNDSFEEVLTVSAAGLGVGRWPYELAVDYTDANQYPFQALQVVTFAVGDPPPAKVVVPKIQSPGIADTGTVEVQVKNLTDAERKVQLGFLLAEGLTADQPRREAVLAAWEAKDLSISVTNRTGLAGSRYPLYVSVEYDDGAVHQAAVSEGSIEILSPDISRGGGGRYLWIGAAILSLLFLALVVYRFAKR